MKVYVILEFLNVNGKEEKFVHGVISTEDRARAYIAQHPLRKFSYQETHFITDDIRIDYSKDCGPDYIPPSNCLSQEEINALLWDDDIKLAE